ncbi:MAG: hypothetical protein HYT15_04800 [Candidatus Magasanikbacteria bacterium]|nr:hypothetical protein [Candidatus Magasanikbacteria bacterium]
MKLKNFIEYLKIIQKIHGDNAEVVMADFIPVVEPVLLNSHTGKPCVVVTDEK